MHADFDSVVAGERFELDEDGDQDPDTWAEVGGTQTLRELRRRSIVFSGNLATNLVMEQTGVAAVTDVMPQVRRMISDQPATDAGIVNAASAREWGLLLGRVPTEVEDVMRGQTYRDGIPAGLPPGTPIANKTGWIDDHTHDMADRPPRRRDAVRAGGADPAGRRTDRRGQRPDRRGRPRGVGATPVTTIERVEVERLSLPLHTPFVTALRRATTVETVVVRVTDSDGRVGLGEAPQNWQVLGDVGGRLGGLPGGTAARRGARPVVRPGRDLARDRPGGGGQRCGQGRARQRPARPGGVRRRPRCRRWSPSRWASRTRSPRPRGRGWPRASGRSSSRSAPTRPPTWPGCAAAREGAGPDVALRRGRQHRLGLLRGGPRHPGARGRRARRRAGRAAGAGAGTCSAWRTYAATWRPR